MGLDVPKAREEMAAIMRKARLHPSLVYAFLKTGLLVGEDSPHTDSERREWLDAVDEWYVQNGGDQ